MSVKTHASNVAGWLLLGTLVGAGCQSNGVLRAGIPPKAAEVEDGKQTVAYTATNDARVYVYDASDDKVVARYQIKTGQRLAVDAQAGRATLAGNEVVINGLNGFHNYKLYFEGD